MMGRLLTRELSMGVALLGIWGLLRLAEPVFLSARNLSCCRSNWRSARSSRSAYVPRAAAGADRPVGRQRRRSGRCRRRGAGALPRRAAPLALLVATPAPVRWSGMGVLVAVERVPAFIITLGGLLAFRGLHWLVIDNQTVPIVEGAAVPTSIRC